MTDGPKTDRLDLAFSRLLRTFTRSGEDRLEAAEALVADLGLGPPHGTCDAWLLDEIGAAGRLVGDAVGARVGALQRALADVAGSADNGAEVAMPDVWSRAAGLAKVSTGHFRSELCGAGGEVRSAIVAGIANRQDRRDRYAFAPPGAGRHVGNLETRLTDLRRALLGPRLVPGQGRLVLVTGESGVGKAHLVRAFLHRHARRYEHVAWFDASNPALLAEDFRAFGDRLDRVGVQATAEDTTPERRRDSPRLMRLSAIRSLLMVFEGAENPDALERFVPISPGGDIIIIASERSADLGSWKDYTLEPVRLSFDDYGTEERTSIVEGQAIRAAPKHDLTSQPLPPTLVGRLELRPQTQALAGALWAAVEPGSPERTLLEGEQGPIGLPDVVRPLLALLSETEGAAAELAIASAWFGPYPIPFAVAEQLAASAGRESLPILRRLDALGVIQVDEVRQRYAMHTSLARVIRKDVTDRSSDAAERVCGAALEACAAVVSAEWTDDGSTALATIENLLLPHVLHMARLASHRRASMWIRAWASQLHAIASLTLWGRGEYRRAEIASQRAKNQLDGLPAGEVDREALGGALLRLGSFAIRRNALAPARRYLEAARRVLWDDHPDYGATSFELAFAHFHIGERDDARRRAEEAKDRFAEQFGIDHPRYADALTILGRLDSDEGYHDRGLERHNEALRIREAQGTLRDIARSHEWIGRERLRVGEQRAADKHFRTAYDRRREALPANHPHLGASQIDLGTVAAYEGRYDKAIGLAKAGLAIIEDATGVEHRHWGRSASRLAQIEMDAGYMLPAIRRAGKALRVLERSVSSGHPWLRHARTVYAEALRCQGELTRAFHLHAEVLEGLLNHRPMQYEIAFAAAAVGRVLYDAELFESSADAFDAAAIWVGKQLPDHKEFRGEAELRATLARMLAEPNRRDELVRVADGITGWRRRRSHHKTTLLDIESGFYRATDQRSIRSSLQQTRSKIGAMRVRAAHPHKLRARLVEARLLRILEQDASEICHDIIELGAQEHAWVSHPILRDAAVLGSRASARAVTPAWGLVGEQAGDFVKRVLNYVRSAA